MTHRPKIARPLVFGPILAMLLLSGCEAIGGLFSPPNADLSALSVSGATLSPAFSTSTTHYTATVSNSTAAAAVSATAAASGSTVSYSCNGSSFSGSATLVEGANLIEVSVTPKDGSYAKTYTVSLTRTPKSTDNGLSALTVGSLTLSPVFASGTYSYSAVALASDTSVLVTPTATSANSTITVNGQAAPSTVLLSSYETAITILVTAQDGTTKSYIVNVSKPVNDGLASLTVGSGTLAPAFSAIVPNYDLDVSNATASITVTATAQDSLATAKINGVASPATVPLVVGVNTIGIDVVLGDGTAGRHYTLTVNRQPASIANGVPLKIVVMDSVNGSTLTNYDATVTDKNNVVTTYHVGSSYGMLQLDSTLGPFVVAASLPGYANASFQGLDPSVQGTVTLYAHKLIQTTRPAAPVTVTGIGTATDINGTGYAAFSGGTINVATTPFLFITATAQSGIEATSWNGFGIKIDLDNMPTVFNGMTPTKYVEQSVPIADGFRSTAAFDLTGFSMPTGNHKLDIVVYDIANNRVETTLTVSPTTGASGADISAGVFSGLKADLRVYGKSRDYFSAPKISTDAMTQYGGLPTSYRGVISFAFKNGTGTPLAILGFDVERSSDGTNFTKLATVNYGTPGIGPNGDGTHTYYEVDPGLAQGVVYTYRVTAFTDATNRLTSGTTSAMIMAPFTASLVGPASKTAFAFDPVNGVAPDFKFSISNRSLWDASQADGFYFSILVRDRSGAPQYFARYRYSFVSNSFQFKYGASTFYKFEAAYGGANSDYMTYSNGVITIKGFCLYLPDPNSYNGSAFAPVKGQDYEWDIFGDYSGSGSLGSSDGMYPAWFQKADASGGIAKSYADVPADGNHTMNGWFEFSVQ